jgi:hypothetical protein
LSSWRNSQLPKEVVVNMSAVPVFTSTGDSAIVVTSTLTDVEDISVYNANSASINLTVTDGNDNAVANLSSYPIDPNTPYDFQFRIPQRCVSGVKIYANSTGLKVDLHGWKHPGFTSTNH